MKKVLFVSHVANFAKFNRNFMRWFRQQGWRVYYASAGEEPIEDCDYSYVLSFNRSPFSFNNVKAYRELKDIIEKENFDIIHCHTPVGGVVTRLAARDARKRGTSVIYTGHGLHFYKDAPILNWILYYPVEKFCARFTDCLITINEEDYSNVTQHKFKASEIRHVHGVGVSLDRFRIHTPAEKEALRLKYGYRAEDYIMIVVAELNKNKNQKFLIKSVSHMQKRFPQIKLLLVGKGEQQEELSNMVKELKLDSSVFFLGYRNDIDCLLGMSDVLVTASYREGLAVNIMEAMASGLPVICTDVRGQRDLIKDGENGFLYPINDEQRFSEAVGKLVDNSELADKIRDNNVRDVRIFSIDHVIKEMAAIYKKYM